MMEYRNKIICGDWVEVLKGLPDGIVQCSVTSPPYWKLRSYGVEGQLGLEKTAEEYVEKLVSGFHELKRVLRDDGVLWLNLGDCYEKKNLCMIPSRVAQALQADGWLIRGQIPWVKRDAMPQSASDRPNSAVEFIFLLTTRRKYFFDMNAVRKEHKPESLKRDERGYKAVFKSRHTMPSEKRPHSGSHGGLCNPAGRNWRNSDLYFESLNAPHGMIFREDELVGLDVNPQDFLEAHFATFPEKLIRPLIKCGTSEKGCCPKCGKPWERVAEKVVTKTRKPEKGARAERDRLGMVEEGNPTHSGTSSLRDGHREGYHETTGWIPSCGCKVPENRSCVVLDPFMGAGTVGLVSRKLGRDYLGIELNEEYCKLAWGRIKKLDGLSVKGKGKKSFFDVDVKKGFFK